MTSSKTPAASQSTGLPSGIRRGAIAVAGGYAVLGASLFMRDALALVILLPTGIALFLIGILLWGFAAWSEARAKGML
jgi:hypothetical protein